MNRIEYAGSKLTIESLVLADNSCPAGDFLDGLSEGDRRKMDTLFARMGDMGQIRNREMFKRLEGSEDIFAFKSYQIRMPCFFVAGGRLILAFGLLKKRDKWHKAEIFKAEEYRSWFMQLLGAK